MEGDCSMSMVHSMTRNGSTRREFLAGLTDGEMLPKRGYRGDLFLSRIRWSKPNRLT